MDAENTETSNLVQVELDSEHALKVHKEHFYGDAEMKKLMDSRNTKLISLEEKEEIFNALRNWQKVSSKDKFGKRYAWYQCSR